jgi:hypothetical protein
MAVTSTLQLHQRRRISMSIDKRVAAVAGLEALGFSYNPDRGWLPPVRRDASSQDTALSIIAKADAMPP